VILETGNVVTADSASCKYKDFDLHKQSSKNNQPEMIVAEFIGPVLML
jgi:hypothetical protein